MERPMNRPPSPARPRAGLGLAGTRSKALLALLWRTDAALTGAGLLLLGALAVSLVGLWVDPRTITGAPAWLKPAKFAISTAIYCFTLAWIFTHLPGWTRTRRVAGQATAAALVLEVALIDLQAWRGTTSHFNVGTPFDVAVFAVMGLTILAQTAMAAAVAVALWRHAFTARAMGWALRLGLSISIVGAATGGLMTRPTDVQLAEARETQSRDCFRGPHRRCAGRRARAAGDGLEPRARRPAGAALPGPPRHAVPAASRARARAPALARDDAGSD